MTNTEIFDVIIISSNYYDFGNNKVEIGGLQTYIRNLSEVIDKDNYKLLVVQLNPNISDGDIRQVGGVTILNRVPPKGNKQAVFNMLTEEFPNAIFIVATDQMDINANKVKSIQIQHGIAFDIPGDMIRGFWGKTKWLQSINKILRCLKNVHRFSQARNTVCVDYNYYNWFRTLGTIRSGQKITVIPNYANETLTKVDLDGKIAHFKGVRKIVFARRFVDYRGTLMFANIIPDVLKKYPHLEITLAGDGPLETELHKRFNGVERVKFTSFDSAHSLEFHREYDVAIVPTIFSEGTSLSLCEAMAAGCFPICTHVGGITNVILDEYNGLSVYPSERELLAAIEKVMTMPTHMFISIVRNAHACSTTTFSKQHWERQWRKVLHDCK